MDSLVERSAPTLLRFGGIMSEYYDWEANSGRGIHYVDFLDTLVVALPVTFGVDSLLQLCERVGIEPLLRAARGHPASYGVTYWSLGNEPDISGGILPTEWGDWTFFRHFGIPFDQWSWADSSFVTPQGYADLVVAYVDSMRARSPIPLEIIAPSLASDLAWIGPVLDRSAAEISFVDLHYYANSDVAADSTRYRQWLASIHEGSVHDPPLDAWIREARDSINVHAQARAIELAVLEYNVGLLFVPDPVWWNYVGGLFLADALGHLVSEGVAAGGLYSIYKKPSPGEFPLYAIVRGDTLSRRMGSHVLELYRSDFGETAVRCASSGAGGGPEAFGSLDAAGDLRLVVVNTDLDNDRAAFVRLQGFVAGDSVHARDISGDAPIGAPWNGTTGIVDRGFFPSNPAGFTYVFPRASVTALEVGRSPATGTAEVAVDPRSARVGRVLPNPFVPAEGGANLTCTLPRTGRTTVTVHDLRGRRVRTLIDEERPAGVFTAVWDGRDGGGRPAASGVYWWSVRAGELRASRKVILVR